MAAVSSELFSSFHGRETIVVNGRFAMNAERLRAARESASSRQILSIEHLAERLAGGFLRMVDMQTLKQVVKDVLPHTDIGELEGIKDLPGMGPAATRTLMKLWLSDAAEEFDEQHPRIASILSLEKAVAAALPAHMKRPGDLVRMACARKEHARAIFGKLVFKGMTDLHPVWRPMIADIAESVHIVWDCGPRQKPIWMDSASSLQVSAPETKEVSAVTCATPRHEAIEAMRWARRLIAEEGVSPSDIAIATAATASYDDHFVTLRQETDVGLHVAHGIPALHSRDGQACAALADVLIRGLSQKRVRRLVGLVGTHRGAFAGLPDNWTACLKPDAALATLDRWEKALRRNTESVPVADVLLPVLETVSGGVAKAEEAGEQVLEGAALEIWKAALLDGPAAALDRTLLTQRVRDERDQHSSPCYMSAEALAATPRKHVRLVGLSSRNWPRRETEDALVPDHVIPSRLLEPLPLEEVDKRDFDTIMKTCASVVLSWPRRDAEGRNVGVSRLVKPEWKKGAVRARRLGVAPHAMSEGDRRLSRPGEFASFPVASSAIRCWRNWRSELATAHDGVIRSAHPRIEAVFGQFHSSTSLRALLRDPLGFVWKYALGFTAPESEDDPIVLDARQFGNIVHEVLRQSVKSMKRSPGGTGALSPEAVGKIVEAAGLSAGGNFELTQPVPPQLVWHNTMKRAVEMAKDALLGGYAPVPGSNSFVEVPFGGGKVWAPEDVPWEDPLREVVVPGTGIRLRGYIDRVDAAPDDITCVIDYKTGEVPKAVEEIVIDGGKEIQRCIYGYAVKSLLGNVKVEAALLYPKAQAYAPLPEPDETMQKLSEYVSKARSSIERGNAVAGEDGKDKNNDMKFALPANRKRYFIAKGAAFEERLSEVSPVWSVK